MFLSQITPSQTVTGKCHMGQISQNRSSFYLLIAQLDGVRKFRMSHQQVGPARPLPSSA